MFGRMPKHKCCREQVVEELSSNFTSTSSAPPKAGTRNCLTAGERPANPIPARRRRLTFTYDEGWPALVVWKATNEGYASNTPALHARS
jgi:hypothetical protein